MLKRLLTPIVKSSLEHMPAVAILGPRQIGKTTLALEIEQSHDSVYLDLESPSDLAKLDDPLAYFEAQQGKLVVLDEIQRMPELFKVLRGVIDKNRQRGNTNGQFLILGSASLDLLQQSAESLAGRIAYHELASLTPVEVNAENSSELDKLWLRGGFPESYLASTESVSVDWRDNFIRTYLERDIPQLGPRIPAMTLRRLWTMLAHLQASLVNVSQLASNLDLSNPTVKRYIDLLADLLMIRRLQPWHTNQGKRLIKTPKIYLRDSGLLHKLLNIDSLDDLLQHPIIGASWEGFVIENILNVMPRGAEAFFYRTSAGAEIDLVLQLPKQELWAIEVKRSSAPKVERGFHEACADIKPTRKFIVYNGDETFPMKNDVEAIPLLQLQRNLFDI
ncbi:MAG: ATP-binding protein [Gammaproteobacteria bacterium]|nr:ATP-binding protein [Gammaproteobacteria bacterium]